MLTIFAAPKPLQGDDGIIQKNGIGSWVRLQPECEVILFGEEPGAAEIAEELSVRHVPGVRRSEFGTKCLDHIFARAQGIARHDLLCYVNCDIIFLHTFYESVARVAKWSSQFLMVGLRWSTPLARPLDFETSAWEQELRDFAMRSGKPQLPNAVDYFAFSRGLYNDVPPFAVGRVYWDHWLVSEAPSIRVPRVGSSAQVLAIHQVHA